MSVKNKEQILNEFSNKIVNNQQDIDPEFVDIVNKNFWLLFDDKPSDNNFTPIGINYEITCDEGYPTFDEFKNDLDKNLKNNNL